MPDPDEERQAKVPDGDETSSNDDGPFDSDESANGSTETSEDSTEETDAHLQTEAFSELDDLHTEAIADSFYEPSQEETEQSDFDSEEAISEDEGHSEEEGQIEDESNDDDQNSDETDISSKPEIDLDSSAEQIEESSIVENYIDNAVDTAPEVDNEAADSKDQPDVTAS